MTFSAFAAWVALTAANNIYIIPIQIRSRINPLGLFLLHSRFFSPRPGSTDEHVLVHDRLSDGSLTEWEEVVLDGPRRVHNALWSSPGRREQKALVDSAGQVAMLVGHHHGDSNAYVHRTVSYLTVLNVATYLCQHRDDAVQTQFMLVQSSGYDTTTPPAMRFISDFHGLP